MVKQVKGLWKKNTSNMLIRVSVVRGKKKALVREAKKLAAGSWREEN